MTITNPATSGGNGPDVIKEFRIMRSTRPEVGSQVRYPKRGTHPDHGFTGIVEHRRLDGSLICREAFMDGAVSGPVRYYDSDGRLVSVETWTAGARVWVEYPNPPKGEWLCGGIT